MTKYFPLNRLHSKKDWASQELWCWIICESYEPRFCPKDEKAFWPRDRCCSACTENRYMDMFFGPVTSPIILQMLKYLFSCVPCVCKFVYKRKNRTCSILIKLQSLSLVWSCNREKTNRNGDFGHFKVTFFDKGFKMVMQAKYETLGNATSF